LINAKPLLENIITSIIHDKDIQKPIIECLQIFLKKCFQTCKTTSPKKKRKIENDKSLNIYDQLSSYYGIEECTNEESKYILKTILKKVFEMKKKNTTLHLIDTFIRVFLPFGDIPLLKELLNLFDKLNLEIQDSKQISLLAKEILLSDCSIKEIYYKKILEYFDKIIKKDESIDGGKEICLESLCYFPKDFEISTRRDLILYCLNQQEKDKLFTIQIIPTFFKRNLVLEEIVNQLK